MWSDVTGSVAKKNRSRSREIKLTGGQFRTCEKGEDDADTVRRRWVVWWTAWPDDAVRSGFSLVWCGRWFRPAVYLLILHSRTFFFGVLSGEKCFSLEVVILLVNARRNKWGCSGGRSIYLKMASENCGDVLGRKKIYARQVGMKSN